ncbi:hypothetical protein vseg_003207 [Gypsophila vaccaria]
MSLSWTKTLVKKLFNNKNKAEDFNEDVFSYEGRGEYWRYSISERQAYTIKKCRIERSSRSKKKIELDDASQVTDEQNYRIFVATWNVAGKSPPTNLNIEDWLHASPPADIYVIGFQEIVPLNAGNVFGTEDNGPARRWLTLIKRTLNNLPSVTSGYHTDPEGSTRIKASGFYRSPFFQAMSQSLRIENETSTFIDRDRSTSRYCLVACKQMVGLFLTVWIKSDLSKDVRDVKISCVGRGLMGYLGNKGSIAISMSLLKTSFCFVCSHLTSGEKEGDELRRNSDVMEILRKTTFPRVEGEDDEYSPPTIMSHDRVIWLGDLNYRVALSYQCAKELIEMKNWKALLENDQLCVEQRSGRVFEGWKEGKICFPPTYKYRKNSDIYTGDAYNQKQKRRTPAWCDRILWHGNGLRQLSYVRGESRFSDHRPVYSVFVAELESNQQSRSKKSMNYSNTRVEVEELLPQSHR